MTGDENNHNLSEQNSAESSVFAETESVSEVNAPEAQTAHVRKQRPGSVLSNNLIALGIYIVISLVFSLFMMMLFGRDTSSWGTGALILCIALPVIVTFVLSALLVKAPAKTEFPLGAFPGTSLCPAVDVWYHRRTVYI